MNPRRTLSATLTVVALILGAGLTYAGSFASQGSSCPDRVTCPLTGEKVCSLVCPLR
jgi:hypothetical protein